MTILTFTFKTKTISFDCPFHLENPDIFTNDNNLKNLIFFIDQQITSEKDAEILGLLDDFFISHGTHKKNTVIRRYSEKFSSYISNSGLVLFSLADTLKFILQPPAQQYFTHQLVQKRDIMLAFSTYCQSLPVLQQSPAPLEHIETSGKLPVNTRQIIAALNNHPAITTFGKDLTNPDMQSKVCIRAEQIEFIVNEFLKFVMAYQTHTERSKSSSTSVQRLSPLSQSTVPQTPAFRTHPLHLSSPDTYRMDVRPGHIRPQQETLKKLSGYCRYFHAPHAGFEQFANPAGRAFIIFTKEHEPEKYFILLKSNTHIAFDSEYAGPNELYRSGGQKQIKLYAILLTFEENSAHNDIQLSSVDQVVTFSKPTIDIITYLKDLPPAQYQAALERYPALRTPQTLSKQAREQLKSSAMRLLLTFPSLASEFLFWDIIAFKDTTTSASLTSSALIESQARPERIIAYQPYSGKPFLFALTNTGIPLETRHYFALSFVKHIKQIICHDNRIPYDLKPENLCYKPLLSNPILWEARLIDYISPGVSLTFLNWPDNTARSSTYSHPVKYIHSHNKIVLDDARASLTARLLLKPGSSVNERYLFRLIAYHMCFEVALMLFCIMNPEASEPALSAFDIHAEKVFKTSAEFKAFMTQATSKAYRSFFFHKLLDNYAYQQDFESPVPEIITNFFTDIQSEMIDMESRSPLKTLTDKSYFVFAAGDANKVLSTLWIDELSRIFTNIPKSPKPASTPLITELINI